MLNHEEALTRFLEAGCVPIDSGVAARLHVRAALTRKNHLFAESDAGSVQSRFSYQDGYSRGPNTQRPSASVAGAPSYAWLSAASTRS